jgi:hypothetical protein
MRCKAIFYRTLTMNSIEDDCWAMLNLQNIFCYALLMKLLMII